MTDTVRERVLKAIHTRLAGLGATSVERNPDDLFARAQMPALALFDGDAERDDTFVGEERWDLQFEIEISVSERTRALTTAEIDVWYGKVAEALAVDITLGGLTSDVRLDAALGPEHLKDADHPYAAMVLVGRTTFAHAEGDPYSLPGE